MSSVLTSDEARARTSRRHLLVVTTAIAVVSDAILLPFYPKLFATCFGVLDPRHVGTYLAATCLTVMVAFPGWALLEKRVSSLPLLVVTQLAAGLFSLGCARSEMLVAFWLLSLSMVACKGSYLLIYPYLLRLEAKPKHAHTIALLTVIVHLGSITGASLGGWLVDGFDPRQAFVIMAAGDFLQMIVCAFLVVARPVDLSSPEPETNAEHSLPTASAAARRAAFLKLAAVMVLFYFSAFIVRPFFVRHWAAVSGEESDVVSGLVFAIPGWVSLLCLAVQHRLGKTSPWVPWALAGGVVGLVLQIVPHEAAIIAGRCMFGWSVFHAMVRLDLLLFEMSSHSEYAIDFSRINFCQQLGVLVAFYAAGWAVEEAGLSSPFLVAAAGFAVTAVVYGRFFNVSATADRALVTS